MRITEILRRMVRNSDRSAQLLDEMVAGIDNQSRLQNEKFQKIIDGLDNQSQLLNEKLTAMIHRYDTLIELQKAEIAATRQLLTNSESSRRNFSTIQAPPAGDFPPELARPREPRRTEDESFDTALGRQPLMIDAKTYNTSHPDYNANLVRNFPGKILNSDKACSNIVLANLKRFAKNDEIPDVAWKPILNEALEEAKTVPQSVQVFERYAYIEKYIKELTEKYDAHYAPGWVNLNDALFLYWLVRQLNPKTVVQTGVCNGLSSAFMMLGLVKNGVNGSLHVVDLPPVFNSKDGRWTVKGNVYGVVIPEGKSSGWMVPDAYQDRFEVWNGDAKALLPKMVEKVGSIDLFYHDSDHTYDHMMFEFREAKRKLSPGGLIVADDVSWNASLWDFADRYGVPSYNFKGAVGVAFF